MYTSVAEIQADFKSITFSSTTNVTDTAVTEFIVEADALINSYVGKVYQVPVTGSGEGLSLLKLLSRSLVAGRVKKIMTVKVDKSTDANQDIVGVLLSPTAVLKILSDIQAKNVMLIGASLLVSGGGFFSQNVSGGVCPVAQKDSKQW